MNDLKFAVRQLLKSRGFTSVALLTLAIGIGANTAIFSVVNGVLLRPLPFRHPEQLVRVYESSPGAPKFPMSLGDFQDYRELNTTLANLAVYTRADLPLSKDAQPELLAGLRITADYFKVLGVQPLLGREFRREDEAPANRHSVILSNGLWRRRFSSDSDIIGKKIILAGEAFTVVGVMPTGVQHVGGDYRSMPLGETVDIWWPLSMDPHEERSSHYVNAVGRLKPGVRLDQASAEFNVIAERLAHQFPDTNGSFRIGIWSLHEETVGRARVTLLVLFGAVFFVLLIGCANIASLLLARATAREREIALRAALGAGQWRIVRQLLTESLLLSVLGGAGGILIARWGLKLLSRGGPKQLPRLETVSLDGNVLLFTLGLSLLTGILFGLAPVWRTRKTDLHGVLKEGGRTGTTGRQQRLRDMLVAGEVALALLLLVGTGLLVRSFWKLEQTDSGFNPQHVVTATVSLPYIGYEAQTNIARFQQELLERLAQLPGVQSAGFTSDLPWTGYDENCWFDIEGKAFPPHKGPGGRYHFVSSDYFRTIGVPLIEGRFFKPNEGPGSPKVVLINHRLAQRYWPGESPVGKRITFTSEPKEGDWRTVVGVVGDVKDQPDSTDAVPALYFSLTQSSVSQVTLAVRTSTKPASIINQVRDEILHLDNRVPIANIRTLETISQGALATRRFTTWLAAGFAVTALVLAGIGIYGMLSYLVAQRTRDLGVHLALGAQKGDIIQLTLRQGMRPTLIGIALGLTGAFGVTRLMAGLLFGVAATDPTTFAACALFLLIGALLPCWLPARRAASVDPMEALRYE